jgi:hypothetical protein
MLIAALNPLIIEKGRQLRTFFKENPSEADRFYSYLFILLSLFDPFPTGGHGGTNLHSGGELQTVYPIEWVVDLPLLQKEVTNLLIHTKSLRESASFRELAKNQQTPVKITVPKNKNTQPTPQIPATPDQVVPVQPMVQPALGSPSHLPESVTPAVASKPTSP